MSVRFKSPLFTFDFIMEQAGVVLEDDDNMKKASKSIIQDDAKPDSFDQYSVKALNQMLEDVLENEDYEKAAKIRDEINKRNSEDS
jgi:protein-arginine kinase activator protein McsA